MKYAKPLQVQPVDMEEEVEDTSREDILAAQIQEQLQKATPPTPLAPPPVMQSGAEQLIETAEKAITGAHNAVMIHVDEMIAKLTSIKESIQIKKEGAIANLKEFVNLSALGLNTVRDLDKQMQELINKHLK